MACFEPLQGFKRRDNGGIGWSLRDVWADVPMTAPCGKCIGCVNRKKRDWSVRMAHEAQMHDQAWFVTPTYDEEHVPKTGTLEMDDGSKFIRSIRKARKGEKISYYLAGEYGGQTKRPHYHIALFGLSLDDLETNGSTKKGAALRSPWLEKRWGKGFAPVSELTPASAAYVAGYVRKKEASKEEREAEWERYYSDTGEIISVTPETARMSNRPAIGKRWIEKYWREVYLAGDFVVMGGREVAPPLYYDTWLEENQPEVWRGIEASRKEKLDPGEYTERRLQTKKVCMEARANLKRRTD